MYFVLKYPLKCSEVRFEVTGIALQTDVGSPHPVFYLETRLPAILDGFGRGGQSLKYPHNFNIFFVRVNSLIMHFFKFGSSTNDY